MPRLSRRFYRRDPVTVAQDLLGQRLVSIVDGERIAGLIVESEAYLGVKDQAAHTYQGRQTVRVKSMWQDGGTAYVYFTYGMHHCMNVVTETRGKPTAVLLRAIEPTEGLDRMRDRRVKAKRDIDLCSGPAKLAQALGITRQTHDGLDLTQSENLFIEKAPPHAHPVSTGPRIGIAYAGAWADKPLRFWLSDHPHVSA